jgi:signal transduction histidine kinase
VDDTSATRDPPPSRTLFQNVLGDRVLVGAFVVCALLIGYQLTVILLQPPWIKPATSWLRAALAWPQMLAVAWVALRLVRTRQPGALAWCFAALGLLSYAVARTTWTIADVFIFPHGVPFPSLPDLFFILQYPCFFVAVFLIPSDPRWLPRLRTMLDAVLWMSAITALTWYFVLLPIARTMGEPQVSKTISMFYQVGDLVILYGLIMALTRARHTGCELMVVSLMSLAVASLFIADTWAAVLLLDPPHTYRTGSAPDLFWFSFYLLVPLAAVVRLRLAPLDLPAPPHRPADRLTWRDALAGMKMVAPSVAVVLASALIIVHATFTSRSKRELMLPEAVAIVLLLLLATLRPAVTYLDQEQLRRERDAARIQERASRLANERMAAYLSTVAHELKTPLASLVGNVQLMGRRLDTLMRLVRDHEDSTDAARVLRALIDWCDQSLDRMARLVEDVLDETRVRQGRLALRLQERDLVGVVGQVVTEQSALNPERDIRYVVEAFPVPVLADARRIEQVVTNYVSNALKFSSEDQPVEVLVQILDGQARVSVHDDGVGVPLDDQPHIWERFYQAEGVDVKCGSQVGFGIGLYVSKAIVEGHQGEVGVESTPGQGSTFWFTLPLAPAPVPAAAPPQAQASGSASVPPSGEHEREQ